MKTIFLSVFLAFSALASMPNTDPIVNSSMAEIKRLTIELAKCHSDEQRLYIKALIKSHNYVILLCGEE